MALRTPCLRPELDWRISRAVQHSTHVEVAVDVEQIHDFRVAELTRASRHCCGTERSMKYDLFLESEIWFRLWE